MALNMTNANYTRDFDLWVLLHFVESDPGSEFDILPHTCITADQPLRPYLRVTAYFGAAYIEAYIVALSADYSYLGRNMKKLTGDYTEYRLAHLVGDTQRLKKKAVTSRKTPLVKAEVIEPPAKRPRKSVRCSTESNDSDGSANLAHSESTPKRQKKKHDAEDQDVVKKIRRLLEDVEGDKENQVVDGLQRNVRQVDFMKKMFFDYLDYKLQSGNADNNLFDDDPGYEINGPNVFIGENRTRVAKSVFLKVNWKSHTAATRQLLVAVFDRSVLATHTLTGKPSPAFVNSGKPVKLALDAKKVDDIVDIVVRKCGVSKPIVRGVITSKCADETKMQKKKRLTI